MTLNLKYIPLPSKTRKKKASAQQPKRRGVNMYTSGTLEYEVLQVAEPVIGANKTYSELIVFAHCTVVSSKLKIPGDSDENLDEPVPPQRVLHSQVRQSESLTFDSSLKFILFDPQGMQSNSRGAIDIHNATSIFTVSPTAILGLALSN